MGPLLTGARKLLFPSHYHGQLIMRGLFYWLAAFMYFVALAVVGNPAGLPLATLFEYEVGELYNPG